LDYIVMQMRKMNREKGYCLFPTFTPGGFLAPILFVHLHILGPQNDHTDFKLL